MFRDLAYTRIAIVGEGAVGSSIKQQLENLGEKYQIDTFNSSTIEEIFDNSYDLMIYAGVRAFKSAADSHPELDKLHILKAYDVFKRVKAIRKVLISTIDCALDEDQITAYGLNRKKLEQLVLKDLDDSVSVLRLPALYGSNVKKNQWHDMIVGPDKIELSDSIKSLIDHAQKERPCEVFNIVSTVSDDSTFIWFNLDTILDAIYFFIESGLRLAMVLSYDDLHRDGLLMTQLDLKKCLRYDHVQTLSDAKLIDYSCAIETQPLLFVRSNVSIDSEIWKEIVE